MKVLAGNIYSSLLQRYAYVADLADRMIGVILGFEGCWSDQANAGQQKQECSIMQYSNNVKQGGRRKEWS